MSSLDRPARAGGDAQPGETASERLRREAGRLEAATNASGRARRWEQETRQPHPGRVRANGYRDAADFLEGLDPDVRARAASGAVKPTGRVRPRTDRPS